MSRFYKIVGDLEPIRKILIEYDIRHCHVSKVNSVYSMSELINFGCYASVLCVEVEHAPFAILCGLQLELFNVNGNINISYNRLFREKL